MIPFAFYLKIKNMKFICGILLFAFYFISSVSAFSWQTCGDKTSSIKITSLDIYTNASRILYVTSKTKVAMNISAPVQAKLGIYKKFFWGWTEIPCVEQIGSCFYEDVCALSPYLREPCPEEFIKNELPCKCPVLQGQYTSKRFPIDLKSLPQWIESGRYKIRISLKKEDKEILCLLLNISL